MGKFCVARKNEGAGYYFISFLLLRQQNKFPESAHLELKWPWVQKKVADPPLSAPEIYFNNRMAVIMAR